MNELLILAHRRRDGLVLAEALAKRAMTVRMCAGAAELLTQIDQDPMAVVVTEEALAGEVLDQLGAWVGRQPAWSDLAFIVLLSPEHRTWSTWHARVIETLANVTLLNRPVGMGEVQTAAAAACRARRRQFDLRRLLADQDRTAALLRFQRDRARLIFELARTVLVVLAPDGGIQEINQVGVEVLGYAGPGEVIGKDWFALLQPAEEGERLRAAFAEAVAGDGGLPAQFDGTLRRADGSTRMVVWRNVLLHDNDRVVGLLVAGDDVTETRRAAVTLAESEARFRAAADAAPALIWMAGLDKGCTWFNTGWLAFTGRSLEAEVGFGWVAGVHPEDVAECLTVYEAAFNRHEGFRVQYRLRRHDRSWRWILDQGAPHFAPDRTFLGYIGCCMDIDDRIVAEQALREKADELETVLEAAPAVIRIARDPECRRIDGNRAARDLLQLPPGGNLSLFVTDPESPSQCQVFQDGRQLKTGEMPLQRAAQGIEVRKAELEFVFDDGNTVHLIGEARPLYDARGAIRGAVAAYSDVTSLKRAHAALRESEQRLRTALEGAGLACWSWNLDTDRVDYQMSATPLFDASSQTCLSRDFLTRVLPEDRPTLEAALAVAQNDDGVLQVEFRVRGEDGRIHWLAGRGRFLREGRTRRVVGVNYEITARKEAEAERERLVTALATERSRLEAILEQMPVGVVLATVPSGKILFRNARADELTRQCAAFSSSQQSGCAFFPAEGFSPEDFPLARTARTGEFVNQEELQCHGRDRTLFLAVSSGLIHGPDERTEAVATFADITELKIAEAHQRQLAEKLAAVVAQKETLIREVYHRVKNNLQVVDSLLMMQSLACPDDRINRNVEDLRQRIHALGLVHEQLMTSKDLKTFRADTFFAELCDHLLHGAFANPEVRLILDVDPIVVDLDTALPLGLLTTELVANSLKHAFRPGQAGEIQVRLKRELPTGAVLIVRDNGRGCTNQPTRKTVGSTIVAALVRQLRATIVRYHDAGTATEIRFPHDSHAAAPDPSGLGVRNAPAPFPPTGGDAAAARV